MKKLTIATRGSKLALWQANHIKSLIENRYPNEVAVDLLVLKTKGDIILDVPLAKVGGKGLFVKEIEEALLDGRADLAVHSMKDVPTELPGGLVLGIIPERETPYDCLLSFKYTSLDALPQGARIGTSSLRRQAQLLAIRPDLDILSLRGNVDTRLRKLEEGEFDAIIMANAGMQRLQLAVPYNFPLTPKENFIPAVGQGALGIEYSSNNKALADMLAFINHPATHTCVLAERGFLTGLNGGCQIPIAGFATMHSATEFSLQGLVANPEGTRILRFTTQGTADKAFECGLALAEEALKQGAKEILAAAYT